MGRMLDDACVLLLLSLRWLLLLLSSSQIHPRINTTQEADGAHAARLESPAQCRHTVHG